MSVVDGLPLLGACVVYVFIFFFFTFLKVALKFLMAVCEQQPKKIRIVRVGSVWFPLRGANVGALSAGEPLDGEEAAATCVLDT